jgi:hypothetical protein
LKILITCRPADVRRLDRHPNLGALVTPASPEPPPPGIPWAIDNGAFKGFDEEKFIKLVKKYIGHPTEPLFVAMPDVVADHRNTLSLFGTWHRHLASHYRRAFVLQDGITDWRQVPWDYCEAVFVGGSTEFKLSSTTKYLCQIARYMGKWVHMGRVNSFKRLQLAYEMGCLSVDGSGFSRNRHDLRKYLDYAGSQQFMEALV